MSWKTKINSMNPMHKKQEDVFTPPEFKHYNIEPQYRYYTKDPQNLNPYINSNKPDELNSTFNASSKPSRGKNPNGNTFDINTRTQLTLNNGTIITGNFENNNGDYWTIGSYNIKYPDGRIESQFYSPNSQNTLGISGNDIRNIETLTSGGKSCRRKSRRRKSRKFRRSRRF